MSDRWMRSIITFVLLGSPFFIILFDTLTRLNVDLDVSWVPPAVIIGYYFGRSSVERPRVDSDFRPQPESDDTSGGGSPTNS